MAAFTPDMLDRAEAALHCKDWLYLNLTGVRATDPSEASFTFGDFRTRTYDDTVIAALGLTAHRHLLPPIVDGTQITHPLTNAAARQIGLLPGTPVSLGYVDMVMTALGAGVYTGEAGVGCSTIGSTGVHMRAVRSEDFVVNDARTGYAILLPVPGMVTQVQTNMAATLNLDWALALASDLLAEFGTTANHADLVGHVERWLANSTPGALVYHPYISDAGERGPFVNARARASLIGLSGQHRFADVLRAVVEGLGMATRDCYAAMGDMPQELRLTGGAARSKALRQIISAAVGAPIRVSAREEAGAAGAAMMAAVAIGAYPDMRACIDAWVAPLLGPSEATDPTQSAAYANLYQSYSTARDALPPVWDQMAAHRTGEPS
jgi:erythritol kinase